MFKLCKSRRLTFISESKSFLKLKPHILKKVVIPINLRGHDQYGNYQGSHWVGLVIKVNQENGKFKNLKQILKNHGVDENDIKDFQTPQQSNGYDCRPWTVLNLDFFSEHWHIIENDSNNRKEYNPSTKRIYGSKEL